MAYSKVTQPITYNNTKVTTDFATNLDFDLSTITDADFWALAGADISIKLDSLTKSIINRNSSSKTGIARMVVTPDGIAKTVNVQANKLTNAEGDVLAAVNCVLSVGCHDTAAAGGNLIDESGMYAGVESAVTREQTGLIGTSVSFGSTSAKISLGDVVALNAPTSIMIELLYFMPSTPPTEVDIFYKRKDPSNLFFLYLNGASLALTLRKGPSDNVDLIAADPFNKNAWNHVLWIWDAAQSGTAKSKIYVNGLKLSYTGTPINALPDIAGSDFIVGASSVGGVAGAKVQEIKVYGGAVAASKTDTFAATRYNNYFGSIWTAGTMTKTLEVTLAHDGNGGSGSISSVVYDEGATVTVAANAFTRAGFTFINFNTAANGTGTSYAPAATFVMPAANVTLFAQWAGWRKKTLANNTGCGVGI